MTEVNLKDQEQTMEPAEKNSKEMVKLIWMCLVSVWITMALILMVGTTSFRTEQKSKSLLSEAGSIKTELTASTDKADKSVKTIIAGQDKMAGEIKKEIANGIAKLNTDMAKLTRQMKKVSSEMGAVSSKMSKVSKAASDAKKVGKSVEAMMKQQKVIINEINNLHNSDRMTLMRKFIENQTAMLNELSSALTVSTARAKKK